MSELKRGLERENRDTAKAIREAAYRDFGRIGRIPSRHALFRSWLTVGVGRPSEFVASSGKGAKGAGIAEKNERCRQGPSFLSLGGQKNEVFINRRLGVGGDQVLKVRSWL